MRIAAAAAAAVLLALPAAAQDAPFGSDADADYAAQIWEAMEELRLAGDVQIAAFPYAGTDPHGFWLETFYTEATIDGHTGDLVVKRNYGPEGVELAEVQGNREEHLLDLTIMFRRADGYDPETGNWFYVKYMPDGSLAQNPDGLRLAGLVGKGADAGCIACHQNADGGDYLYTTNGLTN